MPEKFWRLAGKLAMSFVFWKGRSGRKPLFVFRLPKLVSAMRTAAVVVVVVVAVAVACNSKWWW